MSIKATHTTTRELALRFIESKLSELSNDQIADILEVTVLNRFYNFHVVDSEREINEYMPTIGALHEFPEPNYT